MSLRVRIIFLFALATLVDDFLIAQNAYTLHGTVTDSANGNALIAANIRVLGTSRGTITNSQGAYLLTLEPGAHTIVYSYVGYSPETLRVTLSNDFMHDAALVPSAIRFPEVLALTEDPAVEIIRRAIATKRSWMPRLKTYIFDAFTRRVLRRDTAIASITESYTTGFMNAGDTLREIVRQRRQTENIPMDENFASVNRIVNFNDDAITLFNVRTNDRMSAFTFIGPTSPDALENYDYTLLKTTQVHAIDVYTIRMKPKSRLKPLFDGIITIADGTYAVMGVDVQPNESFTIPFIKNISLRYRQQFALYDSLFWMPTDIRLDGGFTVSLVGTSLPRIGIDAISSIYDYTINVPLPDSIVGRRSLTVDSSATRYDSVYWRTHQILPLTAEEASAYRSLDSTQTLAKQFQPTGVFATITRNETESFLDHVDFHFNRVEGFYFGARGRALTSDRRVMLEGSAGIGFADQRFAYHARMTWYADGSRSIGLGAEAFDRVDNVPDRDFYGPLAISFMALIDKSDYRDYFLVKGGAVFTELHPAQPFHATIGFTNEWHYSLQTQTNYSFFSRSIPYRINPPITDGLLRSIRLALRWGEEAPPLDIVSHNAIELSVEHSSPSIGRSQFDFTRYTGNLIWNFPTFARNFLLPPTLRIDLSAGLGARDLPPQRMFSLDSRASGYAPFGVLRSAGVKEFGGDRFVMIALEHNFRTVPFLWLNMPFLFRNSIELLVHGAFAQTWNGTLSTSNGWYREAGIGIARIFDFLRADLTYRFTDPKRFYVTVSVATLF